jgi:cystathionine beta-lyase/cystathionine gamma-synthase
MPDHQPPLGATAPLVPPLYTASVYTIPDLDSLDRIYNSEEPGFIYARDAHPNARALASQLAEIEAGEWGLVTGSGMAAISAILLAVASPERKFLASNRLYGRTVQLFRQEFPRFGVETEFVDACDLAQVKRALAAKPSMFFVETISNPMLRVVDLAALVDLTRQAGTLLVVDNTFATPALVKPLELGADLVMESLTKMLGGHSDITLGLVAGDDPDLQTRVQAMSTIWGFASNPFDCWQCQRGLETFELRMRAACDNALQLAGWLVDQPGVKMVVYPGLPEHPDHDLAAELFRGRFGSMLCLELEGGREAVNRLLKQAPGIPFSASLGHTTTTLSYPDGTSHRYAPEAEKRKQGITDGLIRLSVGTEEQGAIRSELAKGLK